MRGLCTVDVVVMRTILITNCIVRASAQVLTHTLTKRTLHLPGRVGNSSRWSNMFLTLGAHAQRGLQYLVCPCVCLSVCLCVDAYSGTTDYEAAHKLNQRLQNHKWVKNKKAIFQKRLRSGDMA